MRRFAFTALMLATACSAPTDPISAQETPTMPIRVDGMESVDEAEIETLVSSINPLENDLRGLEVAIRMHNGFLIKPDGARFELGVIDGSGDTRLDEEFTLVETADIVSETLQNATREGFYIRTYKLDEADYDRIHRSDLVLQELKRTAPGENQLKFNAGAITCANPSGETPDEYRFEIFVRTAPDVDFITLTNGDVVMEKENAGALTRAWDPCED